MRRKGKFRPFLLVALFIFCLGLSGNSASTPESNFVWFSDHKSLSAIDTETNQVVRTLGLEHKPQAAAFDPTRNAVWVLMGKHLVKLHPAGAELLRLDLHDLQRGFGYAELLALNPYTGTLWIAADNELLQVSSIGELLTHWRARHKIDALAMDLDESVWVLAQRELVHLSTAGSPLASVDLKKHLKETNRLAIDALGGALWIADKEALLKLNLHRLTDPPQRITAATPPDEAAQDEEIHRVQGLDVHPIFGTVWLATKKRLLIFDRAGNHLKTIDIPAALKQANAIAFDSRALGLWVAGKNAVGRFASDGALIATVPVDKDAEQLAVGPFTLHPTVSILQPVDGALTNNPRPRIRLSLGATCAGAPCLLPDAYTSSLHLDVALNNQAVGPSFVISGPEAFYDPATRLPEGLNTLTARATDLFHHSSETVTSRFTIDTIPPKFLSLSPADGSTATRETIVISGLVDDPTANVILADGNGRGISMGAANFSFSILLKVGLNTFALIARDPAGNETTVALRVTYNPVSVKITSPRPGATLTRRGTLVTGDFQGPPNTGITVNGVLAQVFGNRFYANLSLELGPNTLTAVAVTPTGASATDTLTVNVNAPNTDPIAFTIEPQSGIAPLAVRFSAQSNTGQPITRLDIDVDGDGSADTSVTNPTQPLEHTYTNPGVYQASLTAIDSSGATVSHTLAIVANDGAQMDQFFTALWGGMNEALIQGDIATAAAFLNESAKRKYQPVFEALKPHFPQIIASYSPLRRVSVSADIGEYAVVRRVNDQNRLYLIYFLRDTDGVWRVDGM